MEQEQIDCNLPRLSCGRSLGVVGGFGRFLGFLDEGENGTGGDGGGLGPREAFTKFDRIGGGGHPTSLALSLDHRSNKAELSHRPPPGTFTVICPYRKPQNQTRPHKHEHDTPHDKLRKTVSCEDKLGRSRHSHCPSFVDKFLKRRSTTPRICRDPISRPGGSVD